VACSLPGLPVQEANMPLDACICQTASSVDADDEALQVLAGVRATCPVLKQIMLPDSMWPKFQTWHRQPDDAAFPDRSTVLLALQRGYLSRLTVPIHRYLMKGESIHPDLKKQYRKDLQERWMLAGNAIKRHQVFRMFQGRIAELQFVEWLDMTGRPIMGVEALSSASSDVESLIGGITTAFEVKFIGVEDVDFELMVKSFATRKAAGAIRYANTPTNYLLFRAYEAAEQLIAHAEGERIAVVIVDDSAWSRFNLPWIDWANPQFVGDDPVWQKFIKTKHKKYPNLPGPDRPGDVASTMRKIAAVWILRRSSRSEFSCMVTKIPMAPDHGHERR
jgi:hypothetical protein